MNKSWQQELQEKLERYNSGWAIHSFIQDLLDDQRHEFLKMLIMEKLDMKLHKRRFNDGEQNCSCYLETLYKVKELFK